MKQLFHENLSTYGSHAPALWEALEKTTGRVVELGMGYGSTPLLHKYCEANNRPLESWDSVEEWVDKFAEYASPSHVIGCTQNWDATVNSCKDASVILIDHAPGERRFSDAIALKDVKGILVCHDTEPKPCGGDYNWEAAFDHFKYVKHFPQPMHDGCNTAWTTLLSNTIEL